MTTYAVDELGLFELDANAVEDGTPPPDDWETLCDPVAVPGGPCQNAGGPEGGAFAFTGIVPDPAPQSIFDGGKKDIQDVSQWSHKDGAVPDKSDITNAYAAAYLSGKDVTDVHSIGDLILYFGADRVINNGDTFMGFWFFKDLVRAENDGSFSGHHMPGDTLVLVNFPQANNAVPLIQVVEWDPICSKADNNNPQPGDCAASNLRLRFGAEGAGAICNSDNPQAACAITNDMTVDSPWPYESKDGFINEFPFETFFEGGINISEVIGGDACFASFMAETRSSSSFTASLKDFVIEDFPVCGTELRTEIHEKDVHNVDLEGGSVDAGTFIHDAAFLKVTGPGTVTAEGSIVFTLYNAANCTGTGTVIATVDVATGTTIGDEIRVETGDTQFDAGAISYLAEFISTGILPNATAVCENLTLNKLNTTTVTEIHKLGMHADITNTTQFVGINIHDFAKVTGTGAPTITGNVSFTLYDNATCNGSPIASFGTSGTQVVALNGSGEAETGNFDTTGYLTTDANASLSFKASYGGDTNYNPSDAVCEPLELKKYVPTVITNIHEGTANAGHTIGTPADIQNGFVTIGVKIHDIVAVSGSAPERPTGNVTFTLYDNGTCDGQVISQPDPVKDLTADGKDYLANGRTAESDNYDTTGYVPITLTNKQLSYRASYAGDQFYKSGVEAGCEKLTVNKRLPTISTHVIILDRAEVSGDAAVLPTGTVDFEIYKDTGCTGTLLQTINNIDLVQSNGNLFATLSDANKRIITATGTSSISYKAKYDGDANYVPVTHACEDVTVTLPGPTSATL
ncbi:Ig-like domain-containing protein [Pontibacterium granulatum]|uniref:Ig-like domain-containing protein n=1 Tax=Pontibacterium granulatum TaxID=2036029 RepID=UPI00249BF674|nr:Ig-like domain-containing protein [Pontibacterium granulatum]MDI3324160.1 Ig-like domain-containing protein [Pontibacterium granulatum]